MELMVVTATQDPFISVPADVLKIIFSFSKLQDRRKIANACKRFQSLIDLNPYWRYMTKQKLKAIRNGLRFNRKNGLAKCLALLKDNDWNWKRMVECLSNPSANGYSYRIEDKCIWMGKYEDDELVPSDLTLQIEYRLCINIGNFLVTGNGDGVRRWESGKGEYGEYEGGFHGYAYCGMGKMSTSKDKIRYEGMFSDDDFNGEGTMTWPDGYSFHGEWKDDKPVEFKKCIHPEILKCVDRKQCSRRVTNKTRAPQLLYDHYCQSCHDAGCNYGGTMKWSWSSLCTCSTEPHCNARNWEE